MSKVEGLILDWAGTTVDFGCFAPVNVFIDIFKNAGIDVTMQEAREPMGMLKIDHIRAMLQMPRIAKLWVEKYGEASTEEDVKKLYAAFEPALMASLSSYTDPIPHVLETVAQLKQRGLKIGSTTGYTNTMMDVVVPNAKAKGYAPDNYVTPDDTNNMGRPYPYMIYRNIEALQLPATWQVVKVGDTVSDVKEGIQAGVWTVGVVVGSSELGLSEAEYEALSFTEKATKIAATKEVFLKNGAHFTIETFAQLPALIDQIDALIEAGIRPQKDAATFLNENV